MNRREFRAFSIGLILAVNLDMLAHGQFIVGALGIVIVLALLAFMFTERTRTERLED